MTAGMKEMDPTNLKILQILQENGRMPFSQVGDRVGLTGPAVAERVRRMEEEGVITGYQARVDIGLVGYPIRAYIRLQTPAERYQRFYKTIETIPQILECHHVTGDEAFVMFVVVESMEALESVIGRLSPFGETSTAVVLSTPLQRPAKLV